MFGEFYDSLGHLFRGLASAYFHISGREAWVWPYGALVSNQIALRRNGFPDIWAMLIVRRSEEDDYYFARSSYSRE